MKTFALGLLAFVLIIPASTPAASAAAPSGDKFGKVVAVNYSRVAGARGATRAYRGGYYGRGRYGYYRGGFGFGGRYGYYPYWGYYGYPYAAAFGFGYGWPYGYYPGYYPAYYAAAGPYVAGGEPTYNRQARSFSSSRSSAPTFITSVQSALKSRGYYAGSVDGDFGPSSQKAIAAFQQANGMPATGTLDAPALAALGVGGKIAKAKTPPPAPRKSPEDSFVPPPVAAPVQPPGIPSEPAAAPAGT